MSAKAIPAADRITHDTPVRVCVRMENRRQYSDVKGLTGRIRTFYSSPVGEFAAVDFISDDGLAVVPANVPVKYLIPVGGGNG